MDILQQDSKRICREMSLNGIGWTCSVCKISYFISETRKVGYAFASQQYDHLLKKGGKLYGISIYPAYYHNITKFSCYRRMYRWPDRSLFDCYGSLFCACPVESQGMVAEIVIYPCWRSCWYVNQLQSLDRYVVHYND